MDQFLDQIKSPQSADVPPQFPSLSNPAGGGRAKQNRLTYARTRLRANKHARNTYTRTALTNVALPERDLSGRHGQHRRAHHRAARDVLGELPHVRPQARLAPENVLRVREPLRIDDDIFVSPQQGYAGVTAAATEGSGGGAMRWARAEAGAREGNSCGSLA